MSARARGAALLLGALVCLLARPAAAASIEYLLVEANEGGSSGGHVAIRFGERTYHFQNEHGRLRLRREPTRRLLDDYLLSGNRGVRASRIRVDDRTWHRLRERFEARRLVQSRQLALADSLTRERDLLAALARRDGATVVAVPGAGYLEPAPAAEASPALAALRDRVHGERGPGFLAERRRVLEARLRALDPADTPDPPARASADRLPPSSATFVDRYVALLGTLTALTWIDEGVRLHPGSYEAPEDEALRLAPAELHALERGANALDERIVALLGSPSSGAGYALLVALARRAALERTLETGRLVFLDAWPSDARRIEPASGLLDPGWTAPLVADARVDLDTARERLVAVETPSERELGTLEEVANRYLEASRAGRGGRSLRVARDRLVPARAALRPAPRPAVTEARLVTALARAEARAQSWQNALDRLGRYNLLSHNCVSAVFDTLDAAFADPEADSDALLGGHLDPTASLHFWPLVSAAAVRATYRVDGEWRLAPLRRARVAEMRRVENTLLVALRESNTLTARAYGHSPEDSFFVFFTDTPGVAAARPLLGAINLGASLAQTAWGIVSTPIDGGRGVVAGLRGVAMSVPELGFFNIRKGSYPYVSRRSSRPPPSSTDGTTALR